MKPEDNTRPCGACLNQDTRTLPSGAAYCWARYIWVHPDKVIPCDQAARPNGGEPPGKIWFGKGHP